LIGDAVCDVQTVSPTEIVCTLGSNSAGVYPVNVRVDPTGFANKNIQFTYNLEVSSLSATEG